MLRLNPGTVLMKDDEGLCADSFVWFHLWTHEELFGAVLEPFLPRRWRPKLVCNVSTNTLPRAWCLRRQIVMQNNANTILGCQVKSPSSSQAQALIMFDHVQLAVYPCIMVYPWPRGDSVLYCSSNWLQQDEQVSLRRGNDTMIHPSIENLKAWCNRANLEELNRPSILQRLVRCLLSTWWT